MTIKFSGEVWFWKGPAPWYFITVPERESGELREVSSMVTYGWGMIPVDVRIGGTEWTTSLWPKDGLYPNFRSLELFVGDFEPMGVSFRVFCVTTFGVFRGSWGGPV